MNLNSLRVLKTNKYVKRTKTEAASNHKSAFEDLHCHNIPILNPKMVEKIIIKSLPL